MIGYLKGKIIDIEENSLIIDVNGVGYKVFTAEVVSVNKEESLSEFFIYTHIREDQFDLYGFSTKEKLSIFKLLIAVKGVGPKVALNILSNLSLEQLVSALLLSDHKKIQSVPGIGKKGAERIVLELKGKVEKLGYSADVVNDSEYILGNRIEKDLENDVLNALVSLGYSKKESEERLTEVLKKNDLKSLATAEDLIKLCLIS